MWLVATGNNYVTRIEKSSKFKMAVVTILNVVHHL